MGHHLDMFKGQTVGLPQHLFIIVAQDHGAIVGPGFPGNFRRRQDVQLTFDFHHGVFRQGFRRGQ